MKQTLWIISELFPPEETSTGYIMGEIANAMTAKYNVKVIAGPEVYDKNKKTDSNNKFRLDESIEVTHVAAVTENKSSKLSRIKKFLLMSWRLYKVAKKNIKNGDSVLMVTNPFPLIVLMGHLWRHGDFKLSMLVHDVTPEGLYTDISIPGFAYRIVERIFNNAYASTDMLISIGRDMSEILERKCRGRKHKPDIQVIENWGDVESIKPMDRKSSDKVVIEYAGNIGNAQGVGEFVDVLHDSGCKNLRFNIWGTGTAEAGIKQKVAEYGMQDIVCFNGPYFRSQQVEVLNDCDIALVRLVEGMYGLGVPSKSYNILAAGKPILYIGERGTEIWRMIEENGNGVCFEPSDNEGLKTFLYSLNADSVLEFRAKGKISRKLAEEKYSKTVILNKFLEVV